MNVVDPTGMVFTEESEEDLAIIEKDIVSRVFKNNRKISKLKEKNQENGESKSRNRRIARMQAENSALEETTYELQVLAASDQVYNITHSDNYNNKGESIGGVLFNESTGVFEIIIPDDNLGLLSHELKHAYQFETGCYSSGHKRSGVPFYDIHDEIEAYRRGQLFGGDAFDRTNSRYKDLQEGPKSVHMLPAIVLNSPAELQKIADRHYTNFRYNGTTYRNKYYNK